MKSIFIAGLTMEIGGAERALLGLLNHLDENEYAVDLFLNRHEGEFMPKIPPKVNLLPQNKHYASLAIPFKTAIKNGALGVSVGRIYSKIKAKIFNYKITEDKPNAVELEYSHKYTVPFMPAISKKKYDLAISFCAPHYIVDKKVSAKIKIAWIHTDYSEIIIDRESEYKMWNKYDYIVSISEDVTSSFLSVFPQLESKIIKIENMLVPSMIINEAESFDVIDEMPKDNGFRLLSIGRFCTAKNFDNIPDICRRLRDTGLNVKWYLIGYGGDESLIRQRITEAGLQDNVIILGKKENPYPYIKACDLYIQPSRYEGKCVTVREAQILGKPVVITNYATSYSQLEDGVDGIIVPMDNEGCANGIVNLLNDNSLVKNLIVNCKSKDYSNKNEVYKIEEIL